jgi:hypothetical protein
VSSVSRTVKYIHYTLHYVTTCTVVIDYASRETTVRYDSWDATTTICGQLYPFQAHYQQGPFFFLVYQVTDLRALPPQSLGP